MKLFMFAVYDQAVSAYLPPFYARALGEGLRRFEDAVLDPQSGFGKHPSSYYMVSLGVFDDIAGTFEPHEPQRITSAVEVIASKNLPGQ